MATLMVDGQIVVASAEMQTMLDSVTASPSARRISAPDFLALWTPAEVEATSSADPQLYYAMIRAMAQTTVNLDSPTLGPLLALAVAKGTLTQARATQIAAGIPPA